MTADRVLRVALDMPLRRLFDYWPPPSPPKNAEIPGATVQPGVRVRVPFGGQRLVGIVMEVAGSSDLPPERLKAVLEILDPHPILDSSALGLLRWAAEYYHHPLGEVTAAALPKALRVGARASPVLERWCLTAEGHEALARGEPRRSP